MKHIFYICCFILIISNLLVQAQSPTQNIKFKNLTSAEGLPQNTINCVIQDKQGMLWFGTSDGLNRYDGYRFKVYKNELGNKNSLSNNYVISLLQDRKGHIWIGTYGGGLNRFDPDTEKFVRFEHDKNNPASLAHNDVRSLYEDKEGIIWICTYGGYFNSYNPKTNIFTQHTNVESVKPRKPYRLFSATPDADKGFWLCSEHGLFYFDKETKSYTQAFKVQPPRIKGYANNFTYSATFDRNKPHMLWLCTYAFGLIQFNTRTKKIEKRWEPDPTNPNKLRGQVWSIHQDKQNRYWLGTARGFLFFDPQTDQFIRYLPDPYNKSSISGSNIQKVFEDKAGTIWLCSFDRGISHFNPYLDNFVHYDKIEPEKVNRVGSFCEDTAGNIWIGMSRGSVGLARFDRKQQAFKLFKNNPNNPKSIASSTINTLLADVDGSIWIGTIGSGLEHYNPKTQIFEHFPPQLPQSRTQTSIVQNSPHIGSLFQDATQPDSIWIGTRGSGLFLFDKKSKTYIKHYNAYTNIKGPKITHNTVIDIIKDYRGNLWIATRKGLTRLDLQQDTTFQFVQKTEHLTSISNNYVTSLHLDKDKMLWIGTRNGLNRLDLKAYYDQGKALFTHYTTQQGLPSNLIHKIIEDKKGNLWLSTNKGLSCFQRQGQSFKNYDEQDGLQANEFATGSGLVTKDGAILMGGINGFNLFYPERLQINNYKAHILFTDFQILNKSVPVTKKGLLKRPIWATDTLELSYKDNVFSFEFASLNYIYPAQNTYAIMMENFDPDWRYIGNKHFETYTSLPAGTYTFRVRTYNNDQVLSDKEAQLVIIVHPPWWETTWFRLSAILIIIALLVIGYRLRINSIKKQKRVLKHLVKKRTSELRETNEELQQTNEELQTTITQVKKQNKLIQEFNENITESINYAQVMQNNMLPSLKEIKKYLSESFIFYQPRDVVSGDFYWFTPLGEESKGGVHNADRVLLVAGDCTGHGVPGAFMSIKGAVLLNQIVNLQGITSPEAILHALDHNIHDALNQDTTNNRDGMDIGILLIDFKAQQLEFAGAKNNLLYIHEDSLHEVKGSMLPVGGYPEYKREFKKVTLPLNPDTHYYLTSDGYTDQFGGPYGKKFLKSRFKSLLLDMHKLPMEEQNTVLQKTFSDWKQDHDQIDDILVMGIAL